MIKKKVEALTGSNPVLSARLGARIQVGTMNPLTELVSVTDKCVEYLYPLRKTTEGTVVIVTVNYRCRRLEWRERLAAA